jgi:hypothetical protein
VSELDDLDDLEIDLTSNRSGSAKRIRAGIKFASNRLNRVQRPKWKRQLTAETIACIRKDKDQ